MAGFHCLRCDHDWLPRKLDDNGRPARPVQCPNCRSPYWDSPRLSKAAKAERVRKGTRAYHRARRTAEVD